MVSQSNGARTEIVEIARGVYARLHEGLTNPGIIVGDDGVLVIDSLRLSSFARELRADVRKITDKPSATSWTSMGTGITPLVMKSSRTPSSSAT